MRFVSIDIETTGFNPETCEILEIGAIIEDDRLGLDELPTFRFRCLRDVYTGEPQALSMHRDLFRDLANAPKSTVDSEAFRTDNWYAHPDAFRRMFSRWLQAWGIDPENFVAAGKNFANFDARFLRRLGLSGMVKWHHRILDPGSMYVRGDDEFMPDTNECCKRAGLYPGDIPGEEHTAIHDALVVIALIRNYWEQQ